MTSKMLEKIFVVSVIVSIMFVTFSSTTLAQNNLTATQQLTARMIVIPAGSFQMGSNDARVAEEPVHRVDINSFMMAETEVTQQQWQAVMGINPVKFNNCNNCPVEHVSWDDVQVYLKKLNKKTGQRYRLPSEAEWEFACRSGGKNERYCGGNRWDDLGWFLRNSGKTPHEVKQKAPNGFGLYDMSGNVFEWTQDCWNANYDGAPTNGSAWLSGKCKERVLRGGSWNSFSTPGYMRSVYRFKHFTSSRFNVFGLRLAHDISSAN